MTRRTVGPRGDEILLETIPAQDGRDIFEVGASQGAVRIAGTSGVAICRGFYEYLKDACHCQVTWSGGSVSIPATWPDYAKRRVVCPNRYRYYLSVCTFAYTMAWWDWERWEREIDWMALHGINMPLALTGQEKVSRTLFRNLGLSEESIEAHFSGPAFLPWHRLGNLNGYMGPLPESWIEGQAELQRKILARERELGMTPVTPGFSGFVPVEFASVRPDVKLFSATPWAGFPPTTFIDPRSPAYAEIGAAFIAEYRREFGTDHLYLCETFAEQNPTFDAEEEASYLDAMGRSTHEAIRKADPDGVWVMQGWPFYYARAYWTEPRIAAMLAPVPDEKLIVLDLACNEHEVWRKSPTVRIKGWIYNTLHNFGQTTHLFGDLQAYADKAAAALGDREHGRLLGMGITPEGIDQNPVVYELMTDAMWRTDTVDVSVWIYRYILSRYGAVPGPALEAWNLFLDSVYGREGVPSLRDSWHLRPGDQQPVPAVDTGKVGQAVKLLLSLSKSLEGNERYRRDLVDVTKTWLGAVADEALEARRCEQFFELLDDLDRLMATRPEHRLSTWIEQARSWGTTDEERDLMERNARMLVTAWGGPFLYDYANKEWAGLNRDFNRRRWQRRFEGSNDPEWERRWAETVGPIEESPAEDSIEVVRECLAKYAALQSPSAPKLLSLNKPVRASSKGAERVVDGSSTDRCWHAGPAPQWVEIDLQSEQEVTGVWVYPEYGDGSHYRYTIETAGKERNWKMAVDRSDNQIESSLRGHLHRVSAECRYVRVTILECSAGPNVDLYQVFVFGHPTDL